MRTAHPTERAVGMEYYVSDVDGVGGRLRAENEHFRVEEREAFDTEALDADTGSYPHLVVRATLRGWDTNDFARRISDALGISRERVDWAGTKDKRAVTTQLFSIDAPDFGPEDLPEIDGVTIDPVGRAGRGLQFGDLVGNAFEIVASDVDRPELVGEITGELVDFAGALGSETGTGWQRTETGGASTDIGGDSTGADDGAGSVGPVTVAVPNFFGQQRFGSRRPITHRVGLELVRGDWEGAVMTYLGDPHEAEPAATREARAFVEETRDWEGALERFPRGLGFERAMCQHLFECEDDPSPTDYREALDRLPSNLRRLFVHAAQSYVFNLILSERLERGLAFDRPVEGDVVCFSDREVDGERDDAAGKGLSITLPDTDRLQRVDERRVRSVTRHCERGRAFVTAPLVGTETELAGGEQGEIERNVLSGLDLAPPDFDLPDEYHSTGTRRAILCPIELHATRSPLAFSFSLPKGSYATVVLREYLKIDPIGMG